MTIRLDGRSAEQLRAIAREHGVGYTSLLRSWIEERLNFESAAVRTSGPQITAVGSNTISKPPVQLSGAGRMLRPGPA